MTRSARAAPRRSKLCITPRAFSGLIEESRSMSFCTNCGHDNPEGSNFCGRCGAALTSHGEATIRVPTGDTTKNIPPMVEEHGSEPLTAEQEAAVTGLPKG